VLQNISISTFYSSKTQKDSRFPRKYEAYQLLTSTLKTSVSNHIRLKNHMTLKTFWSNKCTLGEHK